MEVRLLFCLFLSFVFFGSFFGPVIEFKGTDSLKACINRRVEEIKKNLSIKESVLCQVELYVDNSGVCCCAHV